MKNSILLAASLLKNGHVVAFPTETVYGLGASIFHEKGLEAIFSLKGRAKDNPLIVHIHDLDQVFSLVKEVPEDFFLLARAFFPGPLTLILPVAPSISSLVTASLDTIAIRMPNHKIALELLKEVGDPIAAPSANISGKPSPTSFEHVTKDFSEKLPLILDGGECQVGIESTVLSLVGEPTILRPGSITLEDLEAVLGKKINAKSYSTKALCPGMKYRHYAPNAKISLFYTEKELLEGVSQNCWILTNTPLDLMSIKSNSLKMIEYSSQNIYKIFHLADKEKVDSICILIDEKTKKDQGLLNRIEKAATKI